MTEILAPYSNPIEFANAVVPFLKRDEARHNVLLGVIDTLTQRPDVFKEYYLAAFKDASGRVTGVVWMTPPYAFGMTDLNEDQIKLAVDYAKTINPLPSSIFGTDSTAEAFKDLWIKETNKTVTSKMAMRMFEAKEVIEPKPVPGAWRLAALNDLPTVAEWTYQYSIDVHEPLTKDQAKTNAEQAIHALARFIWEIDNVPVTMSGCIDASPTSSRIAWVFTPKNFRGRGYASNLVARITDARLKKGMRVFLYTDLANPTSNKIYQDIGYKPLCDSIRYSF